MDLINRLNSFMLNIGVDYAICGGHAIDLFLGKKTRPHKDLDIVVYWEERDKTIQYMLNDGWDIYEPCGAEYLHKISNVDDQKRLKTNIWCVKPDNTHYQFKEQEKNMFSVDFDNSEQTELDYIKFLFNTRKDEDFLYAKNHDVKMKLDTTILSENNIPYLAPEMVLLYKSTAADKAEYHLDFENAYSKMNEGQLARLTNALHIMFPKDHKWLDILRKSDNTNRIEKLREFIDQILLKLEDANDRRCAYVHLYSVSFSCALIALKRGENVELAVMLHDLYVYTIKDIENHAWRGAIYAREILNELKLTTNDETNIICSAIHNHNDKEGKYSEIDDILIDADVMQHCLYNPLFPIKKHEIERYDRLLKEFGINHTF